MSFSPRQPTKYVGIFYQNVASYTRPRDPTTSDLFPKENQGKYPVISMWNNNIDNKLWGLVNIVNNQAIWVLIASGSGGPALQFTTDSGSSPVFPDADGSVAMVGTVGGGVTTVGGTNSITYQMQTPFSLSNFTFTNNVGINATASANPLIPLLMEKTTAGVYGPVVQNTSATDLTTANYTASNGGEFMVMGIASTNFPSDPAIQGAGFLRTTGAKMVISVPNPANDISFYVGGAEMFDISSVGGFPEVRVFNGYMNLANQSKVNSFQIDDLSVPNGGSANVVIVGTGQHWQFFASTNTNTPNTNYRVAATVLSFDAGSNTVDNFVTSNLTFSTVGNQVNINNAGGATVRVMISGIRYF